MSFLTNFSKHFSLNEEQSKNLFLETVSYIYSVQDKIDNKIIVKFLRKKIQEDYQLEIPQQQMYEKLSQMMGLKNYNIALSKEVEFKNIFMKDFSFLLKDIFIGGYKAFVLNALRCT